MSGCNRIRSVCIAVGSPACAKRNVCSSTNVLADLNTVSLSAAGGRLTSRNRTCGTIAENAGDEADTADGGNCDPENRRMHRHHSGTDQQCAEDHARHPLLGPHVSLEHHLLPGKARASCTAICIESEFRRMDSRSTNFFLRRSASLDPGVSISPPIWGPPLPTLRQP